MRVTTSLLVLLALLGACNTYDPQLPDIPFVCAADEPRCPEGFVAVGGPPKCTCVVAEEAPDSDGGTGGDGGQLGCNDDSAYEPNETVSMATPTVIGQGSSTAAFDNMSICPSSDLDNFFFNVVEMGAAIRVSISFNANIGMLGLEVVGPNGPVATGMQSGNQLVATATAPTNGTYYATVKSISGQNNYSMQIMVTAP